MEAGISQEWKMVYWRGTCQLVHFRMRDVIRSHHVT